MRKIRNMNGITLIALIITIIVLLILAGVSLNAVIGENGILNRAQEAKVKTDEASEKEKIEFALVGAKEFENGNIVLKSENFQKELNKEFADKKVELEEYGNNIFVVTISSDKVDRDYFIDEKGNIIRSDNLLVIDNKEKLIEFRNDVNNGNNYENCSIFLTGNIELNSEEEWIPIGNSEENAFKGTFDGRNNSISGIKITNGSQNLAFFGINKGVIKNLKLLSNNTINVESADNVAGIACRNFNKIENCENNANINGKYCVAGICASNNGGTILGCKNNSAITGKSSLCGGIVGYNVIGGIIENCYNIGNITSEQYWVGGISGANGGKITKCFNKGTIRGNGEVHYGSTGSMTMSGGISGKVEENGIVEFCYNSGEVSSHWNQAGGISGNLEANCHIRNCYNCNNSVHSDIDTEVGSIGGYVESSAVISNCYYLKGIAGSGCANITEGLIEKDSDQMTSPDFINELNNGESAFKFDSNNINMGYPILNWQ